MKIGHVIRLFLVTIASLFTLSCTKEEPIIPMPNNPVISEIKTIVALGDSLTAGYGLAPEDAYPALLERELRKLGYEYMVENAGISGETSAGLLERLDWSLEGKKPSLIILEIGANDAFQGKNVEDIEANLRRIIEKIQAKEIPVLLAGMKAPFNLGQEYRDAYNPIFEKIAEEYDVDFMPFFLEDVALQTRLNLEDRIHPNSEGYKIIVQNIIEHLEEYNLISK